MDVNPRDVTTDFKLLLRAEKIASGFRSSIKASKRKCYEKNKDKFKKYAKTYNEKSKITKSFPANAE